MWQICCNYWIFKFVYFATSNKCSLSFHIWLLYHYFCSAFQEIYIREKLASDWLSRLLCSGPFFSVGTFWDSTITNNQPTHRHMQLDTRETLKKYEFLNIKPFPCHCGKNQSPWLTENGAYIKPPFPVKDCIAIS